MTTARPDDLAQVLKAKEHITEVLVRILTLYPEDWLLQVGSDEQGPYYVQGSQEDHDCLHVELVHEGAVGRSLASHQKEFLEAAGWESPDEDIPNYWMFLGRDEWSPQETSLTLAEALDRVYGVFKPGITDGTFSVMPMEVATAVVTDGEQMVDVLLPGADQSWESVWRSDELQEPADLHAAPENRRLSRPDFTLRPRVEGVNGNPPPMPDPISLAVVIHSTAGLTNLLFRSEAGTWTRRDRRWLPFRPDDDADDPHDHYSTCELAFVDPPFIDLWDRGLRPSDHELQALAYAISIDRDGSGPTYRFTPPELPLLTASAPEESEAGAERAPAIPPNWYPDPWGIARVRWWDGREWTGSISD